MKIREAQKSGQSVRFRDREPEGSSSDYKYLLTLGKNLNLSFFICKV